jgi:hypothetical protein
MIVGGICIKFWDGLDRSVQPRRPPALILPERIFAAGGFQVKKRDAKTEEWFDIGSVQVHINDELKKFIDIGASFPTSSLSPSAAPFEVRRFGCRRSQPKTATLSKPSGCLLSTMPSIAWSG